MRSRQRGFTLVELSIVLVILGLLVGGVLTGQSLIHSAELRSISTQEQRYVAAVHTFRDKYFALPGDMTNATAFWTSLGGAGNDDTCQNMPATGTATCNGDGDGTLNNALTTALWAERYRFWQHLANAGLIEGTYSGVSGTTNTPGVNVAASKIGSAFFAVSTAAARTTGTTQYFVSPAGNEFTFWSATSAVPNPPAGAMPLAPEDAYNIDMKMDDGLPATGTVLSNKGFTGRALCTSAAGIAPPGDAGATYNLSNRSKDCFLNFIGAF